jgi:hypothetical protein
MNSDSLLLSLDGIYRIIGILEKDYFDQILETYDQQKINRIMQFPYQTTSIPLIEPRKGELD